MKNLHLFMNQDYELIHGWRSKLRSRDFDIPGLACLLCPWEFENLFGLTPGGQDSQTWTRLQDDSARNSWLTEDMRPFLVCARAHQLVPCGPDGHGYQITRFRYWGMRALGIIRFMVELTSAILGGGPAAGLLSNLAKAIWRASEIVKNEDLMRLEGRNLAFANEWITRRRIEQQDAHLSDVACMGASAAPHIFRERK